MSEMAKEVYFRHVRLMMISICTKRADKRLCSREQRGKQHLTCWHGIKEHALMNYNNLNRKTIFIFLINVMIIFNFKLTYQHQEESMDHATLPLFGCR